MNQLTIGSKKIATSFKSSTELAVLLAYIIICVIFSILSSHFFSVQNFLNIGIYSAIMGITATGMTMALISGGFDVSVGSVMALVGMVVATNITHEGTSFLPILFGLCVGLACGFANGLLITKAKINPLITTLSTMSVFRGMAFLYTNGVSVIIRNNNFKWLGRGFVINIPFTIILMILSFIVISYILKYTTFGRKVYAVGGNSRASHLSGINVDRIRLLIFTICGFMAGVSGVMLASQAGAGLPQAGQGYEMDIIAACILGGTSLKGGKGNVWGSLLGILVLSTLSNGLTLMNVQTFWQLIIKGMALLAAVVIDVLRGGGYK